MRKRIFLLCMFFVFVLTSNVFASVYVEDTNEYLVNAEQIFEDGSTIEIGGGDRLMLSLDMYVGTKETVSISDGKNTKVLLQDLQGRGVCVRNANNEAIWLFDENGKKIDVGSKKKNFKILLDFNTKTVELEVGGVKVYPSSSENSYTAASEISIAVSSCKSISVAGGKIENVKAYHPSSENKSEVRDADFDMWKSALTKLGIYPDVLSMKQPEDTITRGQYAALVANMMNIMPYEGESAFTDVKATHSLFSEINALNRDGYMVGYDGAKFKPNESISVSQATVVIARMLGYDNVLFDKTESMHFYLTIGEFKDDVLDGITFKSDNQLLNIKDAVHLVYNALTSTRVKELNGIIDGDIYLDKPENTLLAEKFGYIEARGTINKVNTGARSVDVTYKDGTTTNLSVDKALSLLNIEGTKNIMWLDKHKETLMYLMPYKNSRTLYGFVSEYNNGKSNGSVAVENIAKLKISGMDDYIKTESDCTVTVSGQIVTGNVDIIGKLVRLDIEDNKVYAVNIYGDAVDGGLVKTYDTDKITYQQGNVLNNFDCDISDKTVTLINGKEQSYDKIGAGMYFDYVISGDTTFLLLSDKVEKGTLTSYSTNSINIGGNEIPLTSKTMYSSFDGGSSYSADSDIKGFLKNDVTVHLDMAGVARYIYTVGSTQKYGIVFGGEDSNFEKKMYIGFITDGGITRGIYEYSNKNKTVFYPEVSYEAAVGTAEAEDGSCIYKFTVSGNVIKKIEAIDWNGEMRNDGDKLNGSNNRIEAKNSPKYVYINPSATAIALFDGRGEFNPKTLDLSAIKEYKTEGYSRFSFRTDSNVPLANLVVFGKGYANMYNSTWYYGVVSEITESYENDELWYDYTICSPDGVQKYSVLQEAPLMVNGENVKVNDVILYSFSGIENSIMQPLNTVKISLDDDTFTKYSYGQTAQTETGTITYTRDFYVGGTYLNEQSGFVCLLNNGEETWMKKANKCRYYILSEEGDITEAEASDLIGKKIYVSTYEGLVYMLIGKE